MENGEEIQTGTFYAVAIPSEGRYFIIFPDFNHLLPQVSTLDQCPAVARQLLKNILLRRLIDGEGLITPSDLGTCSQNTFDYIRRVGFSLDGDAPVFPVTFDLKALDDTAACIFAFRESGPGDPPPITPETSDYIKKDCD